MSILDKFFRPKSERDFKKHKTASQEINDHADAFEGLDEGGIKAKTAEFKERVAAGESLDDVLPEAFGLVKAACRTLVGTSANVAGIDVKWEMVPYDVQLVGGIGLHKGGISEMATASLVR